MTGDGVVTGSPLVSTGVDGPVDPRVLVVRVVGSPAPQGSKRHVGRGILVESSKALAPWRDSVAWAAREAITAGGATFPSGPVSVRLVFALRRPKSAPKSRVYPDGRPDGDKLARGVLDALDVAGVFGDDGQVVRLDVWKRYARPDEATGVHVTVAVLSRPVGEWETVSEGEQG